MTWRLAKSLEQLRKQINELAPNRSKVSDGTIGDVAHSKTSSDHNPNSAGVVTAMDITHDPSGGVDCQALANSLVASKDNRIKYIIWNYQICSRTTSPWKWRKYTGKNPHNHHIHVSVEGSYDDTREWNIKVAPNGGIVQISARYVDKPLLKEGSKGEAVKELQTKLRVNADGIFGPKTKAAVIEFQRSKGLTPDGIVGPYTWEQLAN